MLFYRYILGEMMPNPFESDDIEYLALVNDELQYSLWPAFKDVPAGWKPVWGPGKRTDCLAWIESTWTDMRPRSLAERMNSSPSD